MEILRKPASSSRPCGARPAGVILAGGRSRRLGMDKTKLSYRGQGLLARSVGLLREVCAEVHVAGLNPRDRGIEADWFPDDQDVASAASAIGQTAIQGDPARACKSAGPMGGIITALRRLNRPCLTISCDQPMLDRPTLERLLAAWRTRPVGAVMTTFRAMETGYIESLCAIYEPAALPLLEAAAAEGVFKLSRAIPEGLRTHAVYTVAEARVFFNVNYPADLALMREIEASETGYCDLPFAAEVVTRHAALG